jgi:hypothetical protein
MDSPAMSEWDYFHQLIPEDLSVGDRVYNGYPITAGTQVSLGTVKAVDEDAIQIFMDDGSVVNLHDDDSSSLMAQLSSDWHKPLQLRELKTGTVISHYTEKGRQFGKVIYLNRELNQMMIKLDQAIGPTSWLLNATAELRFLQWEVEE